MTAPVVSAGVEGGGLEVSFLMPSRFQRAEELPEPLSSGVRLRELPARLEAVHGWMGSYPSDGAVDRLARRLLASLRAEGMRPAPTAAGLGVLLEGEPARVGVRVYGYDPPWTPFFMRLNEVAIEVEAPDGDGAAPLLT